MRLRAAGVASLVLLLAGAADAEAQAVKADFVLKGGTLIDGTGSPRRTADVAVRGGRIVAVGDETYEPGTKLIDARGLIVAPGFIDLHTHSDEPILAARTRNNLNYQAQGVTTIVTGNCGGGALDVAKYLDAIDREGAGANVIHLVPMGTVRSSVMGNAERAPTPAELRQMVELVDRGMKAGAWGVSTGLIYLPGRYAETSELIVLSKVAAKYGGIYASHIRNEGAGLLRSIDEALEIGAGAGLPVHISHLKASGKPNWGLTKAACNRIAEARAAGKEVTADQYPYVASSTKLAAMVVPHWAVQGSKEDFARIADDPKDGPRLRKEIQADLDERDGGASIRIARYAPKASRVGKDLVAIAKEEKTTPLEVVLDIQRHGGAQAISFGMSEDDVRDVMRHAFVATASDGASHAPNSGDKPHPRAYGTFPRKIRYALDDDVIPLEHAVRSCSGLPASILHLPDRGVIRSGAVADIVVFHPNQFRDSATFDQPTRYAPGVQHLFVNGVAVIADGKPQKALPGRSLRLAKDGPADLVLRAKRIWTGDPDHPFAEAVASRGGELLVVGGRAEADRFIGPKTRVVDRPTAFATPGLIDAHAHLTDFGGTLEEIDLRGVASVEEVAKKVKERMAAKPGDGWILGRCWDQSLWPGGAFPTAAPLDAVAADRPVWLRRVDGHAGWANAAAMKKAGVTKDSKAPSDGQIMRDDRGEPTGVFIDGAMRLVEHALPEATRDDARRRILAAQEKVLEAGLTGIHDAGVNEVEAEVFRELDRAGLLKLRVYGMILADTGDELAAVAKPPIPSKPGDRFQLRAVKLFIDGAMGSRGGVLFDAYADDPGNTGLIQTPPEMIEKVVAEGLKKGWQIATHAIGDRGNALVLDAYRKGLAAVPTVADPRLRIEHTQVVRKSDVDVFKSLNVIASMQPSHASDDMRWADIRLGPGRVDGAYAWRWFLDAGVPMAFGSDFPVEVVNPFWGVYAALTRQDEKGMPAGGWHPDQRMSLEETLRGFTAGSAYAEFAETRLGVLKPGYRADLTVMDRDLFEASPMEVLKTRVVATIVDGQVVAEPASGAAP